MGTKANFTRNDVRLYLESFCEDVVKRQIRYLQYLGEMCLTEARNNKGYMMQTGALTSSTGYQVFVDLHPPGIKFLLMVSPFIANLMRRVVRKAKRRQGA